MHQRLSELVNNAGLDGNSSSGTNAPIDIRSVIQGATEQIQQLQRVTQSNVDSITANTDALASKGGSESTSTGSGLLSDVGSAASGLLSGGGLLGGLLGGGGLFGDAISGLAGLFGSGSAQPDFTQYQAPVPQNFELAQSGGRTGDAVDGDNGQPRIAPVTELGLSGVQSLADSQTGTPRAGSNNSGSNQQVTVNIQAMDSQSFMDRSTDIAQAVRSAMLNMSSINDVVNDL